MLAEFLGPDTLAIFIPIFALCIPIVAILVHHQQKMASIIHGGGMNEALRAEIENLRARIAQLEDMVRRQAIAIDELKSLPGVKE